MRVADGSFYSEYAELCPKCGVAGGVRERLLHLSGGGAAARVEDVNNLTFAPAQVCMGLFAHCETVSVQIQHAD
jgi:hypothetical protein